jgi:DNA (cytosine-5)-methyltransferase 1
VSAYYNENEPYAAAWLRNLIKTGLIADGYVDERSIQTIRPMDLWGFDQCHFFAGIGIWSAALRAAGVPDDVPIWTGSCPCQPFSGAGERRGFSDERHLWPVWKALIEECRPPVILGEQVDGGDGLAWLDLVQADLEGMDYACGATVTPAAGFGAPHGRHRIWFVAHASGERLEVGRSDGRVQREAMEPSPRQAAERSGATIEPGDADVGRRPQRRATATTNGHRSPTVENDGIDVLVDAKSEQMGLSGRSWEQGTATFWSNAEWVPCQDSKWRCVEPGIEPLAHGHPCRVEKLRAYGNAIVLPAATEFIKAALGAIGDVSC